MSDTVECRSDFAYAGRPTAFTWQRQRLEVTEILAEWRTSESKGFRVRIADGRVFELTLDEIGAGDASANGWSITIK